MEQLDRLIDMINGVSEGRYPQNLDELTGPDTNGNVRAVAMAVQRMTEKIEAREKRLQILHRQFQEVSLQARRSTIATVTAMAKALAARDAYTEGHAERVSLMARLLAVELGLGEEETELVRLAGLLHDIGKIGFPDYLFLPHGSDTTAEIIREIKRHPATGAEILKDLDFLGKAINYIRYHHERPDGLGYPYGLQDNEIPLGAKIIAVADAFDAITTDRPYQRGSSFAVAISVLEKGAGTKWDPACVAAFRRILPKIPQPEPARTSPEVLLSFKDDRHEILLEPGPPGGARMRWLKSGVDFTRYNSFMLDPVTFLFAADSQYKGIDPGELNRLGDLFNRQLRASLKKKFAVVQVAGPDVARIHIAITDLRKNRPNLSEIATTDFGLAGMTISLGGSGATCAELIVFDSVTCLPIAAARDDRQYGLKERFTEWGSTEDAFQYWADRLSLFLEQAREAKG